LYIIVIKNEVLIKTTVETPLQQSDFTLGKPLPRTHPRSLSSNLTFLELNMITKMSHSRRQRNQRWYPCVFYGAAGDGRNYLELSGCGFEDKRETRF
jgi:hypothetical protein